MEISIVQNCCRTNTGIAANFFAFFLLLGLHFLAFFCILILAIKTDLHFLHYFCIFCILIFWGSIFQLHFFAIFLPNIFFTVFQKEAAARPHKRSLQLSAAGLHGVCAATKTTRRGQPFACAWHGIADAPLFLAPAGYVRTLLHLRWASEYIHHGRFCAHLRRGQRTDTV